MSQIGAFTHAKDGGWTGILQTLTMETKVRLVPNDNRDNDQAPAFRVFVGKSEVGAAWAQRSAGDPSKEYFSVRLDDPAWPEPVTAALFVAADGTEAKLIWNRRKPDW